MTDTFYAVAKPIRLSHKDVLTVPTRTAILEHNARGIALCGWR